MKKRIVGFLITIIAIMFIPVTVKAEEDKKFDNDRCVVTYSLFLQYDGNEKYLRGGYGILAGIDENGGANNLITCASDIVATDEADNAVLALCVFDKPMITYDDFECLQFCARKAELPTDSIYLFSAGRFDEKLTLEGKISQRLHLVLLDRM